MKVELVHYRDPEGYCYLDVFVDGERIDDPTVVTFDPGAGWTRAEWEEHGREILDGLSPAALAYATNCLNDASESEYIDEDREVESFPPQSVSGHEE